MMRAATLMSGRTIVLAVGSLENVFVFVFVCWYLFFARFDLLARNRPIGKYQFKWERSVLFWISGRTEKDHWNSPFIAHEND